MRAQTLPMLIVRSTSGNLRQDGRTFASELLPRGSWALLSRAGARVRSSVSRPPVIPLVGLKIGPGVVSHNVSKVDVLFGHSLHYAPRAINFLLKRPAPLYILDPYQTPRASHGYHGL